MEPASHPILSCEEARALETKLFGSDESREAAAMAEAGAAIATALLRDYEEIGGFPATGRVLVLVGKGHNGGDALIAARAILDRHPEASATVLFALGTRGSRPLAARAWRDLQHRHSLRVTVLADIDPAAEWDLCLDGIFGFQFRAPADARISELIDQINALRIRFRAAVDLPSAGLFRADFTYATGAVKLPALTPAAGRVRYLDLGFFPTDGATTKPDIDRVLTSAVLAPLGEFRPAQCDKRTFGNVFLIGGSRGYPGAILMAAMAAVKSGAGLVTAFVPESLSAAFAAQVPEAMWVGWPETPAGGLALEGQHLLAERIARATALVVGPGLGRESETLALVRDIVSQAIVPLVLDADALQPEIVSAGQGPRILTPHAGEFARIAGARDPAMYVADGTVTLVLKGPMTQVFSGARRYHSFAGGPVLARGGSGDLLAGLIGGLLAQTPGEPTLAACRGVLWHGLAADRLARVHGQTPVRITQLLDFLPSVLREAAVR